MPRSSGIAFMPRAITYAFSLLSPWAYLGFDAFHRLVEKHGLAVHYRPMLLTEVFAETGGLPLAKRHPARQAYRWMELQRWRVQRAVPLNLQPRGFPCNIALADRLAITIAEAGHSPMGYLRAGHRAMWVEDRFLDNETVLASLLAANNLPAGLLEAAKAEAIGAIYESNRDWAIATDIFGAPSYVLDGEIFWGQDRLELLAGMLESGRAPYRADPSA
jgi:2-hydroxychromene-2-carboxylate isomerase